MRRVAALLTLLIPGACATAPADAPSTSARAPHAVRAPAPAHLPAAAPMPRNAGAAEAARRLYTVADTVMIRGAALCESRLKQSAGLRVWIRDRAGPGAATDGADPGVTVFTIAQDGPAARAGLAPDDRIIAVNGTPLPAGPAALAAYGAALDQALAGHGPIAFAYRRTGRDAAASVTAVPACDYRVVFANSAMVNAATDGRSVMVMRGLVNLLSRDDELALVVGHELAHNVLGHFSRGRALGHRASFGPPRGAVLASLRTFEREADYVGLYFVALAGYDYAGAIESARRMSALNPPDDDDGPSTHPSQTERYRVLAEGVREIAAKLAGGGPLRPNLATGRDAARHETGARPFGR